MAKKVTIKDIADMAGVSIATVSHVINRTRYVSPDLVEKIENIIGGITGNFACISCSGSGKCVCPIHTAGDILRIFRQWQIKGTVENTE